MSNLNEAIELARFPEMLSVGSTAKDTGQACKQRCEHMLVLCHVCGVVVRLCDVPSTLRRDVETLVSPGNSFI